MSTTWSMRFALRRLRPRRDGGQGSVGFFSSSTARRTHALACLRNRFAVGDELADPADLSGQHRDRVLAGDRVIQHRRVERPPVAAGDDTGLGDHRPHRLEDPVRVVAGPQLVAPQRQHRRVERLVRDREAGGGFPGDVGLQRPARVAVRTAVQRLQHHHRRHNVGGDRGAAPARREQIGEHLIREQPMSVLGQEPVNRSLPEQMAAQRCRVKQLPIRTRRPLHTRGLHHHRRKREHHSRIAQRAPRAAHVSP